MTFFEKVSFSLKSPVEESTTDLSEKLPLHVKAVFLRSVLRLGQNKEEPNWRLVCCLLVRPAPVRRLTREPYELRGRGLGRCRALVLRFPEVRMVTCVGRPLAAFHVRSSC